MSHRDAIARYSPTEEIANSVTHGIGALLALAGLVAMVTRAAGIDASAVASATVFGASLVALYLASTLYHAAPWPRAKRALQTCDHVAIYVLIAGTYTPFALVTMRGELGWVLFAVVWSLAAAGIVFELATRGRRSKLALIFYLAMGWVAVFFIEPLAGRLSSEGLWWLVAGGLFYTGGAVFYAWNRLPYNHAIWHLFVLVGSVSHVYCVLAGVLVPR